MLRVKGNRGTWEEGRGGRGREKERKKGRRQRMINVIA